MPNKENIAKRVAVFGLCTALIFALQVALSVLPNVELVSLLVIVYARIFRFRAFYIIYLFVVLEGILYGFHLWWISYLYVWTLLALITILFHRVKSSVLWAILSGTFGLCFGALCAIPYLFIGGPMAAVAYWINGIPFDIIHAVSNFILCLVLWKPLMRLAGQILK